MELPDNLDQVKKRSPDSWTEEELSIMFDEIQSKHTHLHFVPRIADNYQTNLLVALQKMEIVDVISKYKYRNEKYDNIDQVETKRFKYLILQYQMANIVVHMKGVDKYKLEILAGMHLKTFIDWLRKCKLSDPCTDLIDVKKYTFDDLNVYQHWSSEARKAKNINAFKLKKRLEEILKIIAEGKETFEKMEREYYITKLRYSSILALDRLLCLRTSVFDVLLKKQMYDGCTLVPNLKKV